MKKLNLVQVIWINKIELISPKVIILLGKVAAERILNSSESMASLRQKIHFYKNTNIPTLVFYHPAYLLRQPDQKKLSWVDLKMIREKLKKFK